MQSVKFGDASFGYIEQSDANRQRVDSLRPKVKVRGLRSEVRGPVCIVTLVIYVPITHIA